MDVFRLKYSEPSAAAHEQKCITCTPIENDLDLIAYSGHWKLILSPFQYHLGTCILALRRHAAELSDLTSDESEDFRQIVRLLEPALKRLFGAALVNFSCLRNWAYRREKPDPPPLNGRPNPHVHWHIVPRYESSVMFEGEIFEDADFGEPYLPDRDRRLSLYLRNKLAAQIRNAVI